MRKQIFLGVDIGATKTIFLAVEFRDGKFQPKAGEPRAHKILEVSKCPTPREERRILKMVEENCGNFANKFQPKAGEPRAHKITGIGIGFAGPVDFKKGRAIAGPNLKTGKIEFKKYLSKKLRIPVAVDNDVKCFLLAESAFGATKGCKNVVGLTLGTGIGGAIMIGGKIYRGANNFAGEVGHTYIGRDVEMEASASGRGLNKIYQELSGKKIDNLEIVAAAKSGDRKALEAIEYVAKILGLGLASLIEIFNPEIIVLGGGLAEVDLIVNKARQYAKKKVFLPSLAKTPIVASKLGQTVVALGAAWMAGKGKTKL